jgi:uncharacterized protein YpuA (DUF1002 family)
MENNRFTIDIKIFIFFTVVASIIVIVIVSHAANELVNGADVCIGKLCTMGNTFGKSKMQIACFDAFFEKYQGRFSQTQRNFS